MNDLHTELMGLLSYGLDEEVMMKKVAPGSKLTALSKAALESYKVFVTRLLKDGTKTDTTKRLVANKYANKQLEGLLKSLNGDLKTASTMKTFLENKVTSSLKPEGTSDILMRQQQLVMVQHLEWSEVLELINSGDTETAKCLELPFARAKFNLHTNPDRAKALRYISEKALLGDQHPRLTEARKAVEGMENVAGSLMGQFSATLDTINKISSEIVEPAA